jgi:hypothetical protein
MAYSGSSGDEGERAVKWPRELALHAQQRRLQIDDEVISPTLAQRPKHGESELDDGRGDCRLRSGALLTRRELDHPPSVRLAWDTMQRVVCAATIALREPR